jgi:hypothetical protein
MFKTMPSETISEQTKTGSVEFDSPLQAKAEKVDAANTASLTDTIGEILLLQTRYAPENTPDMKRRSVLVTSVLPKLLRAKAKVYEPLFSAGGYKYKVQGKDGIGRKAMSAWTRIYDPELSPSARDGWYVVIHFSSRGDCFYLTLGCGATVWKDGSLHPVDPQKLADKIEWAQRCFAEKPQVAARFSDPIVLHGNDLSTQFEKATAFAKCYQTSGFDESQFWDDCVELVGMLISIYDSDRLGKVPFSEAPELREHQAQLSDTVRPPAKPRRGQGRFLSQAEKRAVELHAMTRVRVELEERGFSEIKDCSANQPYDFAAKKAGEDWFIEVKGTTSSCGDSVLVTANERSFHMTQKGRTALAVVYDIDLDRDAGKPRARRGKVAFEEPWDLEQWTFTATAYKVSRKL